LPESMPRSRMLPQDVPEFVFPYTTISPSKSTHNAETRFTYTASPFRFSMHRIFTREVLFSTASYPHHIQTPVSSRQNGLANIYGLGKHTESKLYGNHPIYFEHRTTGTHGVFLMHSNGMDIKINDTDGTSLAYNVIGGVLGFDFLAGSTSILEKLLGNYLGVVGVIANYSAANIPLETIWTDIDVTVIPGEQSSDTKLRRISPSVCSIQSLVPSSQTWITAAQSAVGRRSLQPLFKVPLVALKWNSDWCNHDISPLYNRVLVTHLQVYEIALPFNPQWIFSHQSKSRHRQKHKDINVDEKEVLRVCMAVSD
ncbi:hypothetical protein PHLCEN_2v3290, partial [Hermanssonia centrifuga]